MNKFRTFISQSGINQFSWLNPLFLALFPALVIIWLQPVQFSPLIFKAYRSNPNYKIFYSDLEKDGKSERFHYGNEGTEGHAFVMYYNDNNQFIGQTNFKYPIDITRNFLMPYSIDINNDRTDELVFVSQYKDSIFLDAFDYKTEEQILNGRFISKIGGYNGQHLDHYVNWLGHYDANNDSIPELYFSVAAGFAWYPRKLFRYDFAKDSLIESENTGAGYLPGKIFYKKDSMLIVCGSSAYENIKKDFPFPHHDTTTWLFAFDKNLELVFTPKHYGISPGGIEFPIFKGDFIYYIFASNNEQAQNTIYKMNWQGVVSDSITLDFYALKSFIPLTYKNEEYYLVLNLENDKYYVLNINKFELETNKTFRFIDGNRILNQIDLNNDGNTELLAFNDLNKQLIVFNNNFKTQNFIEIGSPIRNITSNYYKEKKLGELSINTDQETLTFRYHENPHFYFQYPLYLSIYIASLLFVSFILYFQNRRTQQKQVMEQKLADLQLQNLLSQLDPHFTFNVLNSVGNAIYKQDKEGAYDLFQRFTRIIRSSLMSSDKVFRSLNEELRFTQDYLDFQKLRFKNRFDYSIDVEKSLDTSTISILKMLIQGFAENAVKHAFYGVDYTGQINIRVFRENNLLKVIIEDDGIGIKRSKELKITSGTQKGEFIIKEQIRQLNKLYNTNYTIQIIDKSDLNQNKSGTEIIISSWLRLLDSR